MKYLTQEVDVCLLNMPLSMTIASPIGLGLIKSILQKAQFNTEIIYANLLFTEQVGFNKLQKICSLLSSTTNIREWLFSHCVFPNHQENIDEYLELVISELKAAKNFYFGKHEIDKDSIKNELLSTRLAASEFIDGLASLILRKNPKIIGCGSVGAQNMASLAILKKVKEQAPNIITIMGGPNCLGKMGIALIKNFSWVDYVVSGEADDIIAPFCRLLISDNVTISPKQLPIGVFNSTKVMLFEKDGKTVAENQLYGIAKDLNVIPFPDYSDYFITLKKMSYKKRVKPVLLLETSRGCWWGKCTFCALCGAIKLVRLKDHRLALKEIQSLSEKYKVQDIFFVDTILPMGHFKKLIPALSILQNKCNLFFEIKANLNEHQMQQLVKANIRWVQPGIEALNDNFLKLMNKGASTVINLNFLKRAAENGIITVWVFLANFPGEKIEWFNHLTNELSLFHHLHPPTKLNYLMFHRFSHYYEFQEKFNLNLKLFPSFRFIYPLAEKDLYELSYDFYDENCGMPIGPQIEKLYDKYKNFIEAILLWQQAWHKKGKEPVLLMKYKKTSIEILDTRSCATNKKLTFTGLYAAILKITEKPIIRRNVHSKVEELCDEEYTDSKIDNVINELKQQKILYEHNEQLLNLALKKKRKLSFKFSPRSDPCF